MYFTGDDRIDSLLASFKPHWKGTGKFDLGADLTFSFAKFDTPTNELNFGQTQLTSAQKVAARFALQQWANVADITFTEITDTGTFNGNGTGRGDINFINENLFDGLTLAYAFFPAGTNPRANEFSGDVHINSNAPENFNLLDPHEQGLFVLMHELGHAIGLDHPSDGSVALPESQDIDRFTIMVDNVGKGVFFDAGVFPSTPMPFDILAIQHLYGANTGFRASNTSYVFDDDEIVYETIWDAGGKDTLSVAGSQFRAIIDLRAGRFSSVVGSPDGSGGAASKNLAIAFGVTIENATGGTKNDVITGNGAANTLKGGAGVDTLSSSSGNDKLFGDAGNDTLKGSSGSDTLDGGSGNDRLIGGDGNDTYVVNSTSDVVVEASGGGTDSIISTATRTMSDNLEKLTLTGFTGVDGIGNSKANVIKGNAGGNEISGLGGDDSLYGGGGNDTLDGGSGVDRLSGGAGNDRYIVNAKSDVVVEAPGNGTDTVRSSATFQLPDNVEHLTLTGSAAIDGAGNGLDNTITGNGAANALTGGGGQDALTGGAGPDRFDYRLVSDGSEPVLAGATRGAVAGDTIADFASGQDSFQFVAGAFDPDGDIGLGDLDAASFSTIEVQYDGTNPGANANHLVGAASFVFSTADSTLYYDPDGAGGGYTVIATLDNAAQPTATDIEIVA
ncbi:MAG: M10 family metallopeptidase [Alphaproteobacteria bacterium]